MTDEEKELQACLDRVFNYCKSHKEDCIGCIFYRQATIGRLQLVYCEVRHFPEVLQNYQGLNL